MYALWEKILLLLTMDADTPAHQELLESLLVEAQEKMDVAWTTAEKRKTADKEKGVKGKIEEDKAKLRAGRLANLECYLCTQKGHLASFCPQRVQQPGQAQQEPKKP